MNRPPPASDVQPAADARPATSQAQPSADDLRPPVARPEPRRPTLAQFALRVAGPRDAAINLAINSAIPWWFLRHVEAVPIFAPVSMATFFTPMAFLLVFCVVFFGHLNGVMQRKMGLAGEPLAPETPWSRLAVRRGLARGTICAAITFAALYAIQRQFPEAMIPSTLLIAAQGITAAAAAYVLQVLSVLETRKL